MVSHVGLPSHINVQKKMALVGKKISLQGVSKRGFLKKLPHIPCLLDAAPTWRPLTSCGAPTDTQGPPLREAKTPRTDQSFQEAQEHFQEVVTSALTILHTRAAEGQLMLCYWGRAANVEPPDNSDLCCSTVFLPLPTITIGTTSWCYHGNHTVPSAQ